MENEDYSSLVQLMQRSINCLTDQDRNIRKTGLTTLTKQLQKASIGNFRALMLSTNLAKNLIHTLNDPIEINRELTLGLLQKFIKGIKKKEDLNLKRQETESIIQNLVARISSTPFLQKSEDLRQRTIILIRECIVFKQAFVFNISELSNALSKCLGDPSSSIKQQSCKLIDEMCKEVRQVIGKYATPIIKALAENLKHNKFQVRKTTISTIAKLLVTQGAGDNFQHINSNIKLVLSDPKADVRRASLECTAHLLKFMAPKYLKQVQPILVSCLLSGLCDQSPENVSRCSQLLQECGKSIEQLYGEEEMKE